MRERWTFTRVISATLVICFFGLAAKCFVNSQRLRKQYEGWKVAKPLDIVVDLSVAGELVTTFHQTCSSAHNEVICLRLPSTLAEKTAVEQLLDGTKGRIEVFRKQDTNIVASAELDASGTVDLVDGAVPVFRVPSFPKGDYQARFVMTSGAPALRGVSQRLEGRYLLCGMEALPAELAKFGGFASSGVGGVIAIVLLYRPVRVPPRSGAFVSKLDWSPELRQDS